MKSIPVKTTRQDAELCLKQTAIRNHYQQKNVNITNPRGPTTEEHVGRSYESSPAQRNLFLCPFRTPMSTLAVSEDDKRHGPAQKCHKEKTRFN